jgi:hypothetical protein
LAARLPVHHSGRRTGKKVTPGKADVSCGKNTAFLIRRLCGYRDIEILGYWDIGCGDMQMCGFLWNIEQKNKKQGFRRNMFLIQPFLSLLAVSCLYFTLRLFAFPSAFDIPYWSVLQFLCRAPFNQSTI